MTTSRRRRESRLLLMGAVLLLSPVVAEAQTCRLPARVEPAPARRAPPDEVSRTRADHYQLALSWSPEWCRGRSDRLQCQDNSFGFIVHGLWPGAARGPNPRFCAPAPPLDPVTVRRRLCMTPSPSLMQHQWAAHGTCGWSNAQAYFDQTAALWRDLNVPDLQSGVMTAGQIRQAFVAANPRIPRAALQVRVAHGNRLKEVGVCYDLRFRPAACPRAGGTPDAVTVRITPRRR
ncbi:MAG: ribonuclease T [Phenylobacterium sp.]|nr:ribonuclease T [Phenylobacterium sp.]